MQEKDSDAKDLPGADEDGDGSLVLVQLFGKKSTPGKRYGC